MHEVQQVALPDGYLGWTHARQLVRVVRTVTANDGTTTTGQRYYVCSQTRRGITADEAIKLSRYHWRCENDGHWTSDAILEEDARRTVGSRHPVGMMVFALLRMIAQNVMAVLRATSITDSKTRPTWKAVGEHILKAVFPYGIESSVFDDVQSVASAASGPTPVAPSPHLHDQPTFKRSSHGEGAVTTWHEVATGVGGAEADNGHPGTVTDQT